MYEYSGRPERVSDTLNSLSPSYLQDFRSAATKHERTFADRYKYLAPDSRSMLTPNMDKARATNVLRTGS